MPVLLLIVSSPKLLADIGANNVRPGVCVDLGSLPRKAVVARAIVGYEAAFELLQSPSVLADEKRGHGRVRAECVTTDFVEMLDAETVRVSIRPPNVFVSQRSYQPARLERETLECAFARRAAAPVEQGSRRAAALRFFERAFEL
jgi:hypothetical protein